MSHNPSYNLPAIIGCFLIYGVSQCLLWLLSLGGICFVMALALGHYVVMLSL